MNTYIFTIYYILRKRHKYLFITFLFGIKFLLSSDNEITFRAIIQDDINQNFLLLHIIIYINTYFALSLFI